MSALAPLPRQPKKRERSDQSRKAKEDGRAQTANGPLGRDPREQPKRGTEQSGNDSQSERQNNSCRSSDRNRAPVELSPRQGVFVLYNGSRIS